jgi:hypothetical protein
VCQPLSLPRRTTLIWYGAQNGFNNIEFFSMSLHGDLFTANFASKDHKEWNVEQEQVEVEAANEGHFP